MKKYAPLSGSGCMDLNEVKKRVFVSCPFDLLREKYLSRLIEEKINPEIGLNDTILDDFILSDFLEVSHILRSHELSCTMHAPFTDVSLGAVDSRVRMISIERIKFAIDLSALFKAESMVFHTGWERKIYADAQDIWLENFCASLEKVLDHAERSEISIMLENVFELDTRQHIEIFRRFPQDRLGFCLDAGHVYAFSKTPLSKWIDDLGERIGHLHLHDNHGDDDEHLAPGMGIVDFDMLFSWLSGKGKSPVMTLEAHDEQTVIPGLEAVGGLLDRYPL